MSFEMGNQIIPKFSNNAKKILLNYKWPGNIRELKNVVERAVYRSDSEIIKNIELNPFHSPYKKIEKPEVIVESEKQKNSFIFKNDEELSFNDAVFQFKILLLKEALKKTKFNQKKAAQKMGLTYNQFRGLYRKYLNEINKKENPF